MKRTIIILSLLAVMFYIPFLMPETMSSADANIKPSIAADVPEVKVSTSAKKGQVWTLAGEGVTNSYFIVAKVERSNGAIIVHGYVEGLVTHANNGQTYVSDMPLMTLSLGAFNRSVVQLVGQKDVRANFDEAHDVWTAMGAPVSSATIAEITSRTFS
ncbi:hypothetical protein [Hirschia litorea]|uniref:Uncharacterized protein n=1 Tax=Hirschia litorea TaxID=1199156 RepID=A0ABW2IIC3_9PROT